MSIVDQHGRLFGRINVIDAAVALAVVVMGAAAVGLYAQQSDAPETVDVTMTVGGEVSPVVADAIRNGQPLGEQVSVADGPIVSEQVVINKTTNRTRTIHRVRVTLRIQNATVKQRPQYRGTQLYVGQTITVEWTNTRFDGTVRSIEVINHELKQ